MSRTDRSGVGRIVAGGCLAVILLGAGGASRAEVPVEPSSTPAAPRDLARFEPFTGEVAEVASADQSSRHIFSLNDTLLVGLEPGGVASLRARARVKNQEIGIVLDGHYLQGIAARQDPQGPDKLRFVPRYTEENKAVWTELFLKRQRLAEGLPITVGFPDGEMARSKVLLRLHLMPPWQVAFSLALAFALLGLLAWLGLRTPMLRDPLTGDEPPGSLGHFSLGRVQMAWWTTVVVWAFLFLYLFTGSVQLTTSVVILMGIGAATALGSLLIDQSRGTATAAAGSAPPPSPPVPSAPAARRGFLNDLLDDGRGVSLHRLQLFAWTFILSIVFVHSVLTKLGMPDFDNTMLAFMGVSSGTYLGFKLPEKRA